MSWLVLLPLVAGICAYVLCGIAARRTFVADSVSSRSNHAAPVSRAGGIVIGGVTAALFAALSVVGNPSVPIELGLLVGVVFLLGAADDLWTLSARRKLLILAVVAVAGAAVAGPLPAVPIPFVGNVQLPDGMGYPLAAIFLMGFINAFNFMDGLNGMAVGTGAVGLVAVMALGRLAGAGDPLLTLGILSALVAFGAHNVRRGSIFLGDAGSLGVGTFIALAALFLGQSQPLAFYGIVVVFIPYLADTFITFARRLLAGAPVLDAHKEHFYQRLRAAGWPHVTVSLAYAAVAFFALIAVFFGVASSSATYIWAAAVIVAGLFAFTIKAMFKRGGQPMK